MASSTVFCHPSRLAQRCKCTARLAPPATTAKPLRGDDGLEIYLRDPAARCARGLQKSFRLSDNRGRRECRVPAAPADGVTGSPGAFQASRASYGAVCGARRAACLEGRRASLTLMV